MKILYLNHNVAWSGTFFRVFQLARALTRLGHEVTVVTTSRTARLSASTSRRDGVELLEVPDLFWGRGRTGWDPWNTLRRVLRLRTRRFDLIHAFDSRPAVVLPALFLSGREGVPLFMDWADWWGRGGAISERSGLIVNRLIGGVETWFEEAFRARALGTTVISRALSQRAQALGIARDSILRFPNGCEPDTIEPVDRGVARRALGIATDQPLLLHIGLVYPGDLALLLESFRMVLAQMPKTRLVMLGRPGTPVAADLVASGTVLLPGFVALDALKQWLGATDACVIPARDTVAARGRWPGKFNDYLNAGRPTVMPAVGDAAEWVAGEGLGWTSPANPPAYAAALLDALRNREKAVQAGVRAREVACSHLAWETISGRVDTFYQQMLTPREGLAAAGLRTA